MKAPILLLCLTLSTTAFADDKKENTKRSMPLTTIGVTTGAGAVVGLIYTGGTALDIKNEQRLVQYNQFTILSTAKNAGSLKSKGQKDAFKTLTDINETLRLRNLASEKKIERLILKMPYAAAATVGAAVVSGVSLYYGSAPSVVESGKYTKAEPSPSNAENTGAETSMDAK